MNELVKSPLKFFLLLSFIIIIIIIITITIIINIYCTKIRPLLEFASRVCGGLPKYLAEKLQSIQNRCLDIIGIPRTFLPTLEDRCNVAKRRELERIVNDINGPNFQIFRTKPNTSHSYNLTSKPGSVAIPKSGKQRHANSFIARAARLLLWSVIFT